MAKFLDLTGLTLFWGKVKTYIDGAVSAAKTTLGNYTINGKKISSNPTLSKGDLGLGNVTNDAQVKRSEMGVAGGVATLDSSGKVPSTQLPSYVDDMLEFKQTGIIIGTGEVNASSATNAEYIYYNSVKKTFCAVVGGALYANWAANANVASPDAYGTNSSNGRVPRDGVIYVDTETLISYRWSGSELVEVSQSLSLGETSSTAYPGDKGAAAYKHAVTNKGKNFSAGLYKITTNSEGHVTAATAVSKTDITALGIPAQDTTYVIATASKAGLVKPASVITKPTINTATTTSGKYYHVQMSSDGAMFVNVPWTDNNTTYESISDSEIDSLFS